MKIELAKISRAWRDRDYDSVLMVFRPSARGDADGAVEAVTAAVFAANREAVTDDGNIEFACTEAWPGPRGPVFHTTIADTAPAMEAWTAAFARHLEGAGWDGTLTAERSEHPALKRTDVVAMSAVLAIAGWAPAEQSSSTPAWVRDAKLRARITDWALSWVADGEETVYLGLGLTMFRIPVHAAADRLTSSVPAQLINSPDLDHVRSACLDRSGRILVQLRDINVTWQQRLETLTQVLTEFADVTEFGLVRHAYAGVVNLPSIVAGYPPKLPDALASDSPIGYYHRHRFLDTTFVPDACGTQLLGDAHLARAHDLSGWNVTPLGGGKHLVQAKDLAAWFAHDEPDPDVLERARRDFGNVILRGRPPRQPEPTA